MVDGVGSCCDEDVLWWLRLLGGAVWWMRDGERRAGEVFKIRGRVGAWKIKPKARSESAGTSKVILLATLTANFKLASRAPPAHWLARPVAETGSGTVVDLESAPVR
jgi:hypothetical protein